MDVRSQNTWPSLGFDVKAVNQLAGRFLGPGFYYKTFIKPQRLWPLYERVLQRFTHAGHISADTPRTAVDKRYAHPDVLVAGGGPAGLAAAVAAAQAGARGMLVEEEHRRGSRPWAGSAGCTRSSRASGRSCGPPTQTATPPSPTSAGSGSRSPGSSTPGPARTSSGSAAAVLASTVLASAGVRAVVAADGITT